MKGAIITLKGNASGSRKPSRWIVEECINANANDVANTISFARVSGSVGGKSSTQKVNGEVEKSVGVHRLCNACGKKAGIYGAGHEKCFE